MGKVRVTIGIPAYNEEANIKYLLEDLLVQNTSGFTLEKILVYSDGSTDKTGSIVRRFSNNCVSVIDNEKRQGLANAQNKIFKKSNSDILVLLNADIMIKDRNYLKKLILPIIEDKADLTCGEMEELRSPTFIGEVLNTSMKFKKAVFENYKNGNNIYTCHGTARAFSNKLYKKIEFKDSVGEDAYSYLYAAFNNYKYSYVSSAKSFYRLPTNLKDHERQSIRFIQSKKRFVKEFGKNFVLSTYSLPASIFAVFALKYVIRNPLHMSFYVGIYCVLKLKSFLVPAINDKWEMSTSSKVLRAKSI